MRESDVLRSSHNYFCEGQRTHELIHDRCRYYRDYKDRDTVCYPLLGTAIVERLFRPQRIIRFAPETVNITCLFMVTDKSIPSI